MRFAAAPAIASTRLRVRDGRDDAAGKADDLEALAIRRSALRAASARSTNRLAGRSSPRFSRSVAPSYSVRNSPRFCRIGTTWSTKSVSPVGRTGGMMLKPSAAPSSNHSTRSRRRSARACRPPCGGRAPWRATDRAARRVRPRAARSDDQLQPALVELGIGRQRRRLVVERIAGQVDARRSIA